ncbi:MAG TPA: signal peptidase II [Opitutaceae bacterium]
MTNDPPAPLGRRAWAYRYLFGIALVVLILDQVSKAWIVARLPFGTYGEGSIAVIPGLFYIVHVGNTGAAWSLLSGFSWVLGLLAVCTLIAIGIWRQALGLRDVVTQIAFGLLCGGIVGNLADRLCRGHVVDFLDFHFGSYIYPTFNAADSGICVGVGLYLIRSLRSK